MKHATVVPATLGGMMFGLGENEITALLLGVVLGFLTNIVAGLMVGPVATFLGSFQLVWILGYIRSCFPGSDLAGKWIQEWRVSSSHYPETNSSTLTLYKAWDRVAGIFKVTSNAGVTTEFRLYGVYKDNRLTGWWQDTTKHGYFGAFQLSRPPSHGPFVGIWCGYSYTETSVKSGAWIWRRE